jgi:hypothetical protein
VKTPEIGVVGGKNARGKVRPPWDVRKLGFRSAQWAMESGIHGIDCMNSEPLKEAQAMAAASSKATSGDVSLRSFTRLLSNRLSIGVNGLGVRARGTRP